MQYPNVFYRAFCIGLILIVAVPYADSETNFKQKLSQVVENYRDVILLLTDVELLDDTEQLKSTTIARVTYSQKERLLKQITQAMLEDLSRKQTGNIFAFVEYVGGSELHDGDRLAFLDTIDPLLLAFPAVSETSTEEKKMLSAKRSLESLKKEVDEIYLMYRKEITVLFEKFRDRGPETEREAWEEYISFLRKRRDRAAIYREYVEEFRQIEKPRTRSDSEIYGDGFPEKSVFLTFDDGPHSRYTYKILEILKRYGVKACFFQVGENIGKVDGEGKPILFVGAGISREILKAGHMLANHTYSHPFLPKFSDAKRRKEIVDTNLLLSQIATEQATLFRPPYGAQNSSVLDQIASFGMKSMMWDIDSRDWGDPVPESIARRTIAQLMKSPRGIILFHDIHKQSVEALPLILDFLKKQGYKFLFFQSGNFVGQK